MTKKGYEVWCHNCGCLMKKREGKYGVFYGCSGYPRCKNTMNLKEAALQAEEDDLPDTTTGAYWDDPANDHND